MKFLFNHPCNIFLLVATMIIINSCTSNKKYFETFFVGNDGIQYFIKPIECEALNGDKLIFDVVLRLKNNFQSQDSATLNFTVFSADKNLTEQLQLAWISQDTLIVKDVKFMFKERNNKVYSYRFTSKIANTDLKKCFEDKAYQPFLKYGFQKTTKMKYQKCSLKSIRKINEQIMSL